MLICQRIQRKLACIRVFTLKPASSWIVLVYRMISQLRWIENSPPLLILHISIQPAGSQEAVITPIHAQDRGHGIAQHHAYQVS